jgi:ADP-glucose pyrophosphorylase
LDGVIVGENCKIKNALLGENCIIKNNTIIPKGLFIYIKILRKYNLRYKKLKNCINKNIL